MCTPTRKRQRVIAILSQSDMICDKKGKKEKKGEIIKKKNAIRHFCLLIPQVHVRLCIIISSRTTNENVYVIIKSRHTPVRIFKRHDCFHFNGW